MNYVQEQLNKFNLELVRTKKKSAQTKLKNFARLENVISLACFSN